MSYFAGGLRFHEQLYGVVGAQMHISLLGITVSHRQYRKVLC
jgi:Ca2+:H+ antiporter